MNKTSKRPKIQVKEIPGKVKTFFKTPKGKTTLKIGAGVLAAAGCAGIVAALILGPKYSAAKHIEKWRNTVDFDSCYSMAIDVSTNGFETDKALHIDEIYDAGLKSGKFAFTYNNGETTKGLEIQAQDGVCYVDTIELFKQFGDDILKLYDLPSKGDAEAYEKFVRENCSLNAGYFNLERYSIIREDGLKDYWIDKTIGYISGTYNDPIYSLLYEYPLKGWGNEVKTELTANELLKGVPYFRTYVQENADNFYKYYLEALNAVVYNMSEKNSSDLICKIGEKATEKYEQVQKDGQDAYVESLMKQADIVQKWIEEYQPTVSYRVTYNEEDGSIGSYLTLTCKDGQTVQANMVYAPCESVMLNIPTEAELLDYQIDALTVGKEEGDVVTVPVG